MIDTSPNLVADLRVSNSADLVYLKNWLYSRLELAIYYGYPVIPQSSGSNGQTGLTRL